jgi:hypothetical protein
VYGYPGQIWCVVCDADISRAWAPERPEASRIRYFAPTHHAAERLMRYGVPHDHVSVTGYPLPSENIGAPQTMQIAKHDFAHRVANLDPQGVYRSRYQKLITQYAGRLPDSPSHPLTIMFSIGGAGAQRSVAIAALHSLRHKIASGVLHFVLATGTHSGSRKAMEEVLQSASLERIVPIISGERATEYFEKFNAALHTTDILWTKPSELSFYAGLGLPILIAPPLGSHEDFNKAWLVETGAGIPQGDPRYADEWLYDYLRDGRFAEAAMQGYVEIEKLGTFNIEKIIRSKPS